MDVKKGCEDTITSSTRQVGESFSRIIQEIENGGRDRNQRSIIASLKDAFQRFRLWSGSVGAELDSKSRMSLEWRLREAPDIKEEVITLLESLVEGLADVHSIATGKRQNRIQPTDDFRAGDESDSDALVVCFRAINETVDILDLIHESIRSLLRLSVLIRKSSPRSRWDKALQKYSKNPVPDSFDIGHVGEKFPKLNQPDNEWLKIRLGRIITQRRQFQWYCQRHKDHLDGSLSHNINVQIQNKLQASNLEQESSNVPQPEAARRAIGLLPPPTIGSTNASTLLIPKIQLLRDEEDDAISDASSVVSSIEPDDDTEEKLHIPRLEDVNKGRFEFECPICFTLQSSRNQRSWKRHVYSDLKPYVCSCGRGECDLEIFQDRRTWFQHELEKHRYHWICSLCNRPPFDNLSVFQTHVQNMHAAIPQNNLADFAELCKKPIQFIPAADCPFCDSYVHNIRVLEMISGNESLSDFGTILVPARNFSRHVASHMEQLALFALSASNSHEQRSEDDSDDSKSAESKKGVDMEKYLEDQEHIDAGGNAFSIGEYDHLEETWEDNQSYRDECGCRGNRRIAKTVWCMHHLRNDRLSFWSLLMVVMAIKRWRKRTSTSSNWSDVPRAQPFQGEITTRPRTYSTNEILEEWREGQILRRHWNLMMISASHASPSSVFIRYSEIKHNLLRKSVYAHGDGYKPFSPLLYYNILTWSGRAKTIVMLRDFGGDVGKFMLDNPGFYRSIQSWICSARATVRTRSSYNG
ncbi:hypothetical protein BS50DRAFT_619415 [Corynespora cassiicola Philippines]|uniref:Oxidoreductase acuF-like C2H2 type zinc-finger domain-containing protein n=1 Tax=Corynespora cassiicola Philippines TaxID=1448308 RepID=A0A2T2NT62_CORCC|nr:hypothetical protein BS50DRAFT_619415 [Corynespora cassiicola Philippines]